MNLLDKVREAGVIGAGGAGFPTHVKLETNADYILLNAAECEPLLRVDQQLMELNTDEILKGFEAAGRFVDAKKAIIGIKEKHKSVTSKLQERISALQLQDYIEIKKMPDFYPAGDEQVLVYELTSRIVPEGGIPIQVGCVVLNSETALNIYNASQGTSVTEKYITVTGDVPNPLTVKVLVGTPIIDVLKLSGIEKFDDYAVIDGGPMMGPILENLDGYVTKKHKGFVILKKDHHLIRKKSLNLDTATKVNKSACEQCRMCTDMCPRFLLGHSIEPHKMMRAINYAITDIEGQKSAQLCCQCNLCELFSCQAGLYPKLANLHYKEMLAKLGVRYKSSKTEFSTRAMREYRRLPSKRLIIRLGLNKFDKSAPLTNSELTAKTVAISTRQHVGAPAEPVVSVGDKVDAGQTIGKPPENSLGAYIHASIAGEIVKIEKDLIVIRGD
ncbi:4Fe-4S dicluster domain-containing protein [Proteinivorax hydrogeniformans]|uniref:4Fe-4S dicluster domain-containing protein n=1 Tax=Proteinivorax hydrogeniformans TaxID=1826727 RepID=A0AAU8HUA6_9FIRM